MRASRETSDLERVMTVVRAILVLAICCWGLAGAHAQESPKDIIAAHLRLQGYACDTPKSARRDRRASRPDEVVWMIDCRNARYRVRLVPNMADVIEPL
jgi:hypothetical protein